MLYTAVSKQSQNDCQFRISPENTGDILVNFESLVMSCGLGCTAATSRRESPGKFDYRWEVRRAIDEGFAYTAGFKKVSDSGYDCGHKRAVFFKFDNFPPSLIHLCQ